MAYLRNRRRKNSTVFVSACPVLTLRGSLKLTGSALGANPSGTVLSTLVPEFFFFSTNEL